MTRKKRGHTLTSTEDIRVGQRAKTIREGCRKTAHVGEMVDETKKSLRQLDCKPNVGASSSSTYGSDGTDQKQSRKSSTKMKADHHHQIKSLSRAKGYGVKEPGEPRRALKKGKVSVKEFKGVKE